MMPAPRRSAAIHITYGGVCISHHGFHSVVVPVYRNATPPITGSFPPPPADSCIHPVFVTIPPRAPTRARHVALRSVQLVPGSDTP